MGSGLLGKSNIGFSIRLASFRVKGDRVFSLGSLVGDLMDPWVLSSRSCDEFSL